MNGLLDEYGYPQRYDLDAYRSVFGFPIEDYYRRVGFDFGRDPFPLLAESYMQRYNAGVDACPLTEGAAGVIRALAGRGIGQALLSVSRRDYLAQQAARRGLGDAFQAMLGLSDIYGAGKVQLGRDYIAASGADPARCLMVGDTDHDAETARAMGGAVHPLRRRPPDPPPAGGHRLHRHRPPGRPARPAVKSLFAALCRAQSGFSFSVHRKFTGNRPKCLTPLPALVYYKRCVKADTAGCFAARFPIDTRF